MTNMLSVQTMTSREIADLTGKRHDNVLRVCRDLIESGVCPQIEECNVINDLAGGRSFVQYRLQKRDSFVLVARLSPEFTAAVVDRWQELEAGAAPAVSIPQSFSAALRLAAEQAEVIEAQAAQLAIAAPAVEFVESYVASTSGSKGFRAVAKLLEIKEPAFRAFLKEEGIMYQLGGEWMPHAQHLDAGRFEVRAGTAETSGHAYNTAKFTPKGINWIAGKLAVWKLQQVAA